MENQVHLGQGVRFLKFLASATKLWGLEEKAIKDMNQDSINEAGEESEQ